MFIKLGRRVHQSMAARATAGEALQAAFGRRGTGPRFRAGGAGIVLFLSYAREDTDVAGVVAGWLASRGHDPVSLWRSDQTALSIDECEQKINQADEFVALMSPAFLTSPLCRRERELAMSRQKGLKRHFRDARFVHVVLVRGIDDPVDGLPPSDEWLDLAGVDLNDQASLDAALWQLMQRFGSDRGSRVAAGPGVVSFRNRSDELDLAIRGLTNFAGPHFWLIVAPPQLGKTWFLDRLGAILQLEADMPWDVRLIDIRDQKAEVRTDVASLIGRLFGPDGPTTPDGDTYLQIAQRIIASDRPHLVLIDSAELLPEETARALRECLGKIHDIVRGAGSASACLSVVVASQRDDEWRGITPAPRLSILKLTEFSVDVVEVALQALALDMNRGFEKTALQRDANRAHQLSEGLPALLVLCIAWIRFEQWASTERLEDMAVFRAFAQPYIQDDLFARESLLPSSSEQPAPSTAGLPALIAAFRVLAPYRLFTQSHLRHHRALDEQLAASMADLGWDVEDLWRAISRSALLVRPLNEPWQQIPRAIRRLLYRYFYVDEGERARAHQTAREFIGVWADQQPGKEQIVGLVETLWHQIAVLRLEGTADFAGALLAKARELSAGLRESMAYTPEELRVFAAERIRDDEEFQKAVGDDTLVGQVIAAIVAP
jgi:TIR domain